VAYCKVEDLLVGSTALPKGMEPQAYVDGAADEIDMRIGFTYVTPVDISETSPVERPVRLILKTLNVHLATGRLCLAMAKNAQRTDLEPYGASLVRDALAMIGQIERGEITLIGAVRVVQDGRGPGVHWPADLQPGCRVERRGVLRPSFATRTTSTAGRRVAPWRLIRAWWPKCPATSTSR
jgi:hypothetical protein